MGRTVDVLLDPDLDLSVTVTLPESGATVQSVKEELCRQDPTGDTRAEDFFLCSAEGDGGVQLADDTLLSAELLKLRLVPSSVLREESEDANAVGKPGGGWRPSVYAISDVHTDHPKNMKLLNELPHKKDDVILLAGDVSHNLEHVRKTLGILVERFGYVFYCPGNHDVWLHSNDGCKHSIEKLHKLRELCEELGVHTKPLVVGDGLLIVPLISWYEYQFDTEPDVRDDSLLPLEMAMTDFRMCKWPPGLSPDDGSLAKHMDELNESVPDTCKYDTVISFSHFLPRRELMPEKRYLMYPPLAKVVGSGPLGERVRQLKPHCHVFGHTHYGWSQELDGINYLQAAVAYPNERDTRGFALDLHIDKFNHDPTDQEKVGGVTSPVLVYDGQPGRRTFPKWRSFWSEHYAVHPRRPSDVRWMYRPPRDKQDVYKALKKLVREGKPVTDEAVERLIPKNAGPTPKAKAKSR